jgi:hypothetical protein
MIPRLLIFIKHHLPFIWAGVEWLNAALFSLLHAKKTEKIATEVIGANSLNGFLFRKLNRSDIPELERLLYAQPKERVAFFNPHGFETKTLKKVEKNPAFIMMGVFDGQHLVGYFFLRCFWNKKCFVGRLIDEHYESNGIGRVMNAIMYNIAWVSGFKCLSTISKNNKLVMRSHAKNNTMKILKELDNDYLLVEFVKPNK